MTSNQLVGWGMLIAIAIAFLNAVFLEPNNPASAEGVYSLAGVAMIVFGIWSSVKLLSK